MENDGIDMVRLVFSGSAEDRGNCLQTAMPFADLAARILRRLSVPQGFYKQIIVICRHVDWQRKLGKSADAIEPLIGLRKVGLLLSAEESEEPVFWIHRVAIFHRDKLGYSRKVIRGAQGKT